MIQKHILRLISDILLYLNSLRLMVPSTEFSADMYSSSRITWLDITSFLYAF